MSRSPIRVLVVDDSAITRKFISRILSDDADLEVVGHASNPIEARHAIKALDPDVITLDVVMPEMNGLEFLRKIMELRPTPVIMVSNVTQEGAATTIEALEIGAIDCVAKPSTTTDDFSEELVRKVKVAAKAKLPRPQPREFHQVATRSGGKFDGSPVLIAIGASTGGIEALTTILQDFPENCPPTVITQHLPARFTQSFADRLDRHCRSRVSEAKDGALLLPGNVYVAPGGDAHLQIVRSDTLRCKLLRSDPVNGHRPSVDVMFESVAANCRQRAIGVILTGMGQDGANGLLRIREAGGRTIGQDEATSLIYGMPKAAAEIGAVQRQAALGSVVSEIFAATVFTERGHSIRTLPTHANAWAALR